MAESAGTGRPFRGIGEPIWAERSLDELAECERHEALLNLAFAGGPAWRLACPYDTTTLPATVLDEAKRNHPYLWNGRGEQPSDRYAGPAAIAEPFARPLPEPTVPVERAAFEPATLADVRAFVAERAVAVGTTARAYRWSPCCRERGGNEHDPPRRRRRRAADVEDGHVRDLRDP